jgi:diguanylate cyclase (GGDEF)-like protein
MTAPSIVALPESAARNTDQSASTTEAAAAPRRVPSTFGSAATSLLSGVGRRAASASQTHAGHSLGQRVKAFTTMLADDPSGSSPEALVYGAARLVDADMAVLTIVDPHSGRHFVRGVHGGGESAMGVEVVPGVGITGQALTERRLLIATPDPSRTVSAPAPVVAALPALRNDTVVATLTVRRSDTNRPFDTDDRAVLDLVGPIVALAVGQQLASQDFQVGVARDDLTGLYNAAYLDASFDQMLALRRRVAPADRQPMSLIMFEVDGFAQLGQAYGRHVADEAVSAVAAIIRQRFRASDTVARVAPGAFFAVLNGVSAQLAAEATAQIRQQASQVSVATSQGEPVNVSLSTASALYRDGDRPEVAIKAVRSALDSAQSSGPGASVTI